MATSVNPNGRFTSAVSFNIRGIQLSGDKLKVRMILLYDYVNIHSVDELHLQEVFTYEILRELIKNMPHFKHVVYEKGVAGPKGGLVSFYRECPIYTRGFLLRICLTGVCVATCILIQTVLAIGRMSTKKQH
jgi:hypothetical protein